jgi:hypothetical protein
MFFDDRVNPLCDFRSQINFAALAADQGRHVLEFVEFGTPWLLVSDELVFQRSSTFNT